MRKLVAIVCLLGCGDDGDGALPVDAAGSSDAVEAAASDIVSTELALDVGAHTGVATITMTRPASGRGTLEIGDLQIASVEADGVAVDYTATAGLLDVELPADPTELVVAYGFASHGDFDGWDDGARLSFLWPYFCGNLFPCHSEPADGARFTMAVTGVPGDAVAVYPASIAADAPSYMPAVAVDSYTEMTLAPTAAGTALSVWYRPGEMTAAAMGAAHLTEVFDFYERTYGPYPFGGKAGSVSANWGAGAYGGMEHHPYWHVASGAFDSEEVHAHEAGHGWFGNGVRIRCWEDFVLSEGTVTYLAAHALAQSGVDVWPDYRAELDGYCGGARNTIAWPTGCNEIDILNDPLWSGVPYQKGAFFYRDVAARIGEGVLDEALAGFFQAHVGRAAGMQDMIDAIESTSGMDVEDLAGSWLKTLACPAY
jgi:aminopeptidase N